MRAQQLSELEEVISVAQNQSELQHMQYMWGARLMGCRRGVDVWQRIIGVRMLVVPPEKDVPTLLKFASLCIKSNRLPLCHRALIKLIGDKNAEVHTTY